MMRLRGSLLGLAIAVASAGCSFPTEEFGLGAADTGTPVDLGVPPDDLGTDTGPRDTGTPDTNTPDTGTPDTGTPDTGTPDVTSPDTGTPDVVDAGPSDDVFDAGKGDDVVDAGSSDDVTDTGTVTPDVVDAGPEDALPDVPTPIFCATSRPCPSGLVCDDGICESACPTGQSSCMGFCRATQTDINHCGTCSNVCMPGQECRAGACNTVCTSPTVNCGNVCRDPQADNNHCGGCNRPCTGGTTCTQGACQCPSGQSACNAVCTNVQSDPANCGNCGNRCATGQLCSNGACTTVCGAGQTNCGGTCRNVTNDVGACGSCTNVCRAPTGGTVSCVNSNCVAACPTGRITCSNACVDPATSSAHCGACGNACSVLSACTGGVCCLRSQSNCGGVCRSLDSDVAHCGACNRACSTGQVCRAGGCEWPFRISTLSASNCATVQHSPTTGDDRGGIAANVSYVLYSGDSATGRFNALDLATPTVVSTPANTPHDGIVSDLQSGLFWSLSTGTTAFNHANTAGIRDFTRLVGINPATGALTGTSILLSRPISVDVQPFNSRVGIFAGYGRVLFYDGARMYNITLPSGVVTDLGAVMLTNNMRCENWAFWGVAEYFGNTFYVTYAQTDTLNSFPVTRIARTAVSTGATTTLFSFTAPSHASDLCSFTAVPGRSRWYFHWEGTSQFGTGDEGLGYCSASFTVAN